MYPPQAFTLCHEWAERWLPEDPLVLDGAAADQTGFDPVRCAFVWVDCAVREIVPLALEALDLPGQASALRQLAPVEDEATGFEAMHRLTFAAKTAAALVAKYHFCSSARLAVEEAIVVLVASQHDSGKGYEQTWRFQGLFSESGALDMVIHRAIGAGAPREEVLARLRACMKRLVETPRPALASAGATPEAPAAAQPGPPEPRLSISRGGPSPELALRRSG